MLALLLLGFAAAPLGVALRWPDWAPLPRVLAGGLTALFLPLAVVAAYFPDGLARWERPTTPPSDARPSVPRVPKLTFLPVSDRVPHCVTLAGVGTIPHGHQLALFDRATDSAGQYTPGSAYSYDGVAAAAAPGGGWTAPQLYLGAGDSGDENNRIAVVAVLMPERTTGFLAALTSSSDRGMLPDDVMNLGTTTSRIIVVRNADNARCPD
ncbi:hypothetical protein ACGF5O_44785 [Streptomyces sp. NPDC048291]|uniref:hypothetical protein n=1 Tax=unclassified Streptomyces TaxID=2593676 RepID=UPI0034338AC0